MSDSSLLKLVDLIKRELGAEDARVEIGGAAPDGPDTVWAQLPGGWRLVALFRPGEADTKKAGVKLRHLAESFFELPQNAPQPSAEGYRNWTIRKLDDELVELAARTGALSAAVIDFQSPVLWGMSEPRHGSESVTKAIEIAGLLQQLERVDLDLMSLSSLPEDEQRTRIAASALAEAHRAVLRHELAHLRQLDTSHRKAELFTYRALASVRASAELDGTPGAGHFRQVVHGERFGFLARSFASIYVLVLTFDANYSELHAEAALLHALPVVERLVVALPPIEPPPKGGRVVKLPLPGREG